VEGSVGVHVEQGGVPGRLLSHLVVAGGRVADGGQLKNKRRSQCHNRITSSLEDQVSLGREVTSQYSPFLLANYREQNKFLSATYQKLRLKCNQDGTGLDYIVER